MSTPFEAAKTAFMEGVQAAESGALEEAEAKFLEALRLVPSRPSTLVNLASVRHRLGRPQEALVALEEALTHASDDAQAWFHHGQLLQMVQRPADALRSYERVLALDATQAAAWTQRGSLLKDMGHHGEAAHCFRQALAHGGDEALNRYFLASAEALSGTQAMVPDTAPRHYVEALFDSYAEGFDEHLVSQLGYRTPWVLAEMVLGRAADAAAARTAAAGTAETGAADSASANAAAKGLPSQRFAAALDLGCGTGLMGPLLKPHVQAVDGIDLSSQMLAKARELGCYRELVHGDIVEYLQHTAERYALVVAADVFVYVGDLAAVFSGVARVLEPRGCFAFSLEEAGPEVAQFTLRASSRYAHREGYVRELAVAHGFVLKGLARTTLRHEQRQPIGGLLVLMERSGAD